MPGYIQKSEIKSNKFPAVQVKLLSKTSGENDLLELTQQNTEGNSSTPHEKVNQDQTNSGGLIFN